MAASPARRVGPPGPAMATGAMGSATATIHDTSNTISVVATDASCTEGTTDVLLEVAYFDPERIAATGRSLNLTSDARSRFERGVDPAFLDDGLAIATRLVLEICGGTASGIRRGMTARPSESAA